MEREDLHRRGTMEAPGDPRDERAPVIRAEPASHRTADSAYGDGFDERSDDDRADRNPAAIRAEDTEPYLGLQYIARLFKVAAMVVIVALTAEIVAGVALEGASAILPLLAEVIRGTVLAAILWGAGDLTLLLIDVGHDVRAARVLLGRLSARAAADSSPGATSDG
jgi:hypothetical protein